MLACSSTARRPSKAARVAILCGGIVFGGGGILVEDGGALELVGGFD
jgi:hypothetical protein